MADETNPRSLDFQLSHLSDLYAKLPRHLGPDLQSMQAAVASLRRVDLQTIVHPMEGSQGTSLGIRTLDRLLKKLEELLPSWSNSLSSHYFSHARSLPISMGSD